MGEYCNKDINSSVGGLVWVRRRNGSWWPGRILEPAELPESCLPTPRSGTPVKLLGREDASVDWYNLEKSKRVKAFRCGEYNECIEKAKATSNSSRKAVKYARREDAILHALELESAHLEKDQSDFSSETDVQDSEHHEVDEQPTLLNPSEESKDIKDDSSSSEDDLGSAPEGVKRMRGLDDLGIGAMSSLKRKRSPVAHVHEFLKRKHRRRTLTKVLENTPMVSVPIGCDQLALSSDSKVSELESDQWKNYNLTGISNNVADERPDMVGSTENDPSDRLFEVPLTDDSHNPSLKIDKGTSMWQIKGKRNSRVRKVDLDHESDLRSGQDVGRRSADGSISGSHTCPENELPGRQRLLPYRRSRFTVNPKYDSPDFSYKHHNAGGSGLYEVTVEVRTGSQPQQTPYVSLMSMLNGQPIVGHLLTVEVIDDGFCDQRQGLLSKSRRNGLLSKKTRKLSSLTGLERQTERERLVVGKDKDNAIACVPLKVVFSRINAALHM